MRPNKEILFQNFDHLIHSLNVPFENSTKFGMTYLHIFAGVNTAEIIIKIARQAVILSYIVLPLQLL